MSLISPFAKPVLDRDAFMARVFDLKRPGEERVYAFYEHRAQAICTDPRAMLIPLDDHLVHRGDGVFESLMYEDGKLYQLRPHLERMERSSRSIHLEPPCSWEEIEDLIIQTARAGGHRDGMLRVLLGRGAGGFGIDPAECPVTSLHICAYELKKKPEAKYEQGCTAFRSSIPAKQSWIAKIKSIDYLPNMLMVREAREKGYDYPVCFDEHNFLAEGAIENVCIVSRDGTIVVPEFTNALMGTTLLRALELVKDEERIFFKKISEDEILDAREFLAVGTTQDVMPIVRYGDKPIHDARPGPMAKKLRQLLKEDRAKNSFELFD